MQSAIKKRKNKSTTIIYIKGLFVKLKALLLACTILGSTTPMMSNPTSQELRKSLIKARAYVTQNSGTIAQATAGTLTCGAGSILTGLAVQSLYKEPTKDTLIGIAIVCISAPAAYCGYHTLNDALNNKPNDFLKNLVQKAKAQFQKPKVNEQK